MPTSLARAKSPCIEIECVCLFLLFREIIVYFQNRARCLLKQCLAQSGVMLKVVPCSAMLIMLVYLACAKEV